MRNQERVQREIGEELKSILAQLGVKTEDLDASRLGADFRQNPQNLMSNFPALYSLKEDLNQRVYQAELLDAQEEAASKVQNEQEKQAARVRVAQEKEERRKEAHALQNKELARQGKPLKEYVPYKAQNLDFDPTISAGMGRTAKENQLSDWASSKFMNYTQQDRPSKLILPRFSRHFSARH